MFRFVLARIFYMWGSLHRNFGNRSSFHREHQSAIRRFSQAYDMDPKLRNARLDRGILLYREMGQLDDRAMVFQERGQYTDSLTDLEAYLQLSEQDPDYRRIAERTTKLLRQIVAEINASEAT
jgi:tetratricopeptide (TPR) repeat protein